MHMRVLFIMGLAFTISMPVMAQQFMETPRITVDPQDNGGINIWIPIPRLPGGLLFGGSGSITPPPHYSTIGPTFPDAQSPMYYYYHPDPAPRR